MGLLVRERVLPAGLLLAIDAERSGAEAQMSLIDWLIHRGHITEEQLVSVLAYCLRLGSLDPAPELANRAETNPVGGSSGSRAQISLQKTGEHLSLVPMPPHAGAERKAQPAARRARAPRHPLRVVK